MLRLIPDQPPVASPVPPCHPCPLLTPAALGQPPSPPQHVRASFISLFLINVELMPGSFSIVWIHIHFLILCSDQWESPFPANLERSAIATAAVQQWAILFLLFITGEPAAASHLWGSPVEQAEALFDHAAAVWQRHFPRDRRQCPKPCSGPRGRCFATCDYLAFNQYCGFCVWMLFAS